MHSTDGTPRFRTLSYGNESTPRYTSLSTLFNEKDQDERRDPEKECFMCRQANIYMHPIGMQQERRVARRHPPPLTRAQIEELSQKKSLTKREARLLLQCFFPEIKNVKYFQLHRYHSCCYDPKHLNLCKNHITAFQHEENGHSHHHHHHDDDDEDHYKDFEREGGGPHANRVSFVRIKIEPTKGIPTRFIGPAALPSSLATMLIKQVNRFEEKKKPITFESKPLHYQVRRIDAPAPTATVPHAAEVGRLSEYLSRLSSSDDDNDDEDEENSTGVQMNLQSRASQIRGFDGKVADRSRLQYEHAMQMKINRTNRDHGDLIVEDLDELDPYFAHGRTEEVKPRRRRTKKRRVVRHRKPKLNHWEIKALEQAKQEVCGCRHHVRRLEADHVIYDWCRCKDHQHQDLKLKPKPTPPPPLPPPEKIEKKSVALDAMPTATHDIAVAYDASDVDYRVIQETLYYRTTSGRLVKPEISSSFPINSKMTSKGKRSKKKNKDDSFFTDFRPDPFSKEPPSLMIVNSDGTRLTGGTQTIDGQILRKSLSKLKIGGGNDDDDDDDDDDDESETDSDDEVENFIAPKYVSEDAAKTPVSSPVVPLSMQKSSKPSYLNARPTPNFERESSILANRRWFDQPLGDQNLSPVQDGRYGLIAGTTAEEYQFTSTLPDNDYVEPYYPTTQDKSNCTIC